jgi:hypothetical protein
MSVTLDLPQVERELEKAEQRAAALRKIAEGLRELNGSAAELFAVPVVQPTTEAAEAVLAEPVEASVVEDGPRGREAVRRIVAERPGIWSLADLRAEMKQRGWWTSDKGVEVAVHRMKHQGEARYVRAGVYDFPGPESEVDAR